MYLYSINFETWTSLSLLHTFFNKIYFCRHNDNCVAVENKSDALPTTLDEACTSFLQRGCGPDCGPGAGGDSCGDRIATFILHLATPTKGGRTVFPFAKKTTGKMKKAGRRPGSDDDDDWYCEMEQVLGLSPNPGDATLFWDYKPTGGRATGSYHDGSAKPGAEPVFGAMHSGCPVLEGEKCKQLVEHFFTFFLHFSSSYFLYS